MNSKSVFSVKLSAPGKVILFGEYSVIFRKPALAATLCLHTKLHLCETNSGTVQLDFSALNIHKTFCLKDIRELFRATQKDCWDTYLKSLKKFLECLYEKSKDHLVSDLTEPQVLSLLAFFHCFAKFSQSCEGFSLKIDSELPVGSGVGSSASFSVVLSAAALLFEYYSLNSGSDCLIERKDNGEIIILEKFRNQISQLAHSCEKIFHGSPSGIDHNTILNGFMLEFTKSDDDKNIITPFSTCPMEILLVNSNVPRSTKKNVDNVKKLKESYPEIIGCVLDAMENIVKDAVNNLVRLNKGQTRAKDLEAHFGDLISLNHNLLRVLGTSHPALESIVSISQKYGLHAKLTGGGGGGFGFVYIPSNTEASIINRIDKELTAAGFKVYDVVLGGPGLTIEELIL